MTRMRLRNDTNIAAPEDRVAENGSSDRLDSLRSDRSRIDHWADDIDADGATPYALLAKFHSSDKRVVL